MGPSGPFFFAIFAPKSPISKMKGENMIIIVFGELVEALRWGVTYGLLAFMVVTAGSWWLNKDD